jgi:hypothetical protein
MRNSPVTSHARLYKLTAMFSESALFNWGKRGESYELQHMEGQTVSLLQCSSANHDSIAKARS